MPIDSDPDPPDAAYQAAARQAWAQAVPELRAAWEEHTERFPERTRPTPRTQPDGGWVADGDRRLTPEQNTEAAKACADLRAPGVTVRGALDKVPDAVRYTLTHDDARGYVDGVLADVDGLKAEGFELIKLKNLWHAERSPLLHAANRGDTMLDFTEITKEEAEQIVGRIRAQADDDK